MLKPGENVDTKLLEWTTTCKSLADTRKEEAERALVAAAEAAAARKRRKEEALKDGIVLEEDEDGELVDRTGETDEDKEVRLMQEKMAAGNLGGSLQQ